MIHNKTQLEIRQSILGILTIKMQQKHTQQLTTYTIRIPEKNITKKIEVKTSDKKQSTKQPIKQLLEAITLEIKEPLFLYIQDTHQKSLITQDLIKTGKYIIRDQKLYEIQYKNIVIRNLNLIDTRETTNLTTKQLLKISCTKIEII